MKGLRGRTLAFVLVGSMGLLVAGCGRDNQRGPAEKTGREIDDAVGAAKDAAARAAEHAAETTKNAAAAAGEEMHDAAAATAAAAKDAAKTP